MRAPGPERRGLGPYASHPRHPRLTIERQACATSHGSVPGTQQHYGQGARAARPRSTELTTKCPILSAGVAGSRAALMVTMGECMGTKSIKAHVSLKSA